MKVKFLFAWYDFWVGLFWDAKKHRLYVFPLPMLGFYVTIYGKRCWVLRKRGLYYRPNAQGYTSCFGEAGRFTYEEAKKHEYLYDEPVTMHHVAAYL